MLKWSRYLISFLVTDNFVVLVSQFAFYMHDTRHVTQLICSLSSSKQEFVTPDCYMTIGLLHKNWGDITTFKSGKVVSTFGVSVTQLSMEMYNVCHVELLTKPVTIIHHFFPTYLPKLHWWSSEVVNSKSDESLASNEMQ